MKEYMVLKETRQLLTRKPPTTPGMVTEEPEISAGKIKHHPVWTRRYIKPELLPNHRTVGTGREY